MNDPDTIDKQPSTSGYGPHQQVHGSPAPPKIQPLHECRHSLGPNGGHNLGRDDPLWPRYVEEADKWDDVMMGKWNSSMDVLLIFATLFSAIVTAFVVETSQKLQPDNSAISASALIEIAGALRSMANNEQISQNITTPLASPDSFRPSTSEFIVNLLWFISLCLSITVALLASLVKQWCYSFISGRAAPPCNQARIRQARLDKLLSWRTELIVSALPVIMHVALGLFLIGLIIFLRDLHYDIYIVIVLITVLTLTFYIGTTVIPFFVSFCPFETPLSSLKAWGYCYQVCWAIGIAVLKRFIPIQSQADLVTYMSPCEQKERETFNNTSPDEVTGHALNWVIKHSQRPETREMAIRSISGLQSQDALEQLVMDPPGIFPQVVQSFTACFDVTPPGEAERLSLNKTIDEVSLHGEALERLVNLVAPNYDRQDPDYLARWGVDNDTKEAVKERFQLLAKNDDCPHGRALGLIGLSAWYDFVGHTESRFNRADIVNRLTQSLHWSLSENLCTRILHALMAESVYWAPDVDSEHRANILNHLVALIPTAPTRELRSKLACALAVLLIGLNRGPINHQAPPTNHHGDLEAAGGTHNRASLLVQYYRQHPDNFVWDEQALLLFALTGLMEHYEHCEFDDQNQASMKIVAEQISTLDNLKKPRPVTLPMNTGIDSDIRVYFVETLVLYFKQARTPFRSRATDDIFVALLQSVKNKRQVWIDHSSLIIIPIIQILAHTDSVELTAESLSAILAHWDEGPSLLYSRMLFSYEVPRKLVRMIKDGQLRSSEQPQPIRMLRLIVPVFFGKLAEQVETELTSDDNNMLVSFLEGILRDNLLETLVRDILNLEVNSQTGRTQDEQAARETTTSRLSQFVTLYDETYEYLEDRAKPTEGGEGAKEVKAPQGNELLLAKLFKLRMEKITSQQLQTPNLKDQGEASSSKPTGDIERDLFPESSQLGSRDVKAKHRADLVPE